MKLTKFVALYDTHYGHENRNGHKVALHDPKAISVALQFIKDFKPDVVILGGDILDCGAISHHSKGKPGRTEGLRIMSDAKVCREEFIKPLIDVKASEYVYLLGNHEDWLNDLVDETPGIAGLMDVKNLLDLPESWKVLPQGSRYNLGRLWFVHGDQLPGGGMNVARKAVTDGGRSIRFGHYHTFSASTKVAFLDEKCGHTGLALPCLCSRDPKYGEGKGNSWIQGMLSGFILPDGSFNDYVSIITNGRMVGPNGKVYSA